MGRCYSVDWVNIKKALTYKNTLQVIKNYNEKKKQHSLAHQVRGQNLNPELYHSFAVCP